MKIKIEKILFVLVCLITVSGVLSYEKYIHKNMYVIFQCITVCLQILFLMFFLKLNEEKKSKFLYNAKKNWYVFLWFGLMIIVSMVSSVYNKSIIGLMYTIMFFIIMIISGMIIPVFFSLDKKYIINFMRFLSIFATALSLIAICIYHFGHFLTYSLVDGRVASIMFDPNFFGTFVAIGTICAFNEKKKICRFILIIINTYAIILSGSRGALLSLLITFLVFFILTFRKINFKNIVLLISFLVIAAYGMQYLEEIGFFREYQGSGGRFEMISFFIEQIQEKPIFGYGYGSASSLLESANYKNASSHNSLADYTIGYGIPCAVLFVCILCISVLKGMKKENNVVFLVNILLIINSNTILYNLGGVGICSILWTIFLGMNILEVKDGRTIDKHNNTSI